jgi:hypothetical protein
MADEVLQRVKSVHGHIIRITTVQWSHVTEAHDYMSGNLDKVLETLSEPSRVLQGSVASFWRSVSMRVPTSLVKLWSSSIGINKMDLSLRPFLPPGPIRSIRRGIEYGRSKHLQRADR